MAPRPRAAILAQPDDVRVLPVRHRTSRPDRLLLRRPDSHHRRRFLLGQRLQILLKTDHPAPDYLFRVRQVRPHPHQFGFEFLPPHRRGLPPRFQNRPHRRHPPPPQHLDRQRVETSVTDVIPYLTSDIRTWGSERERERPLKTSLIVVWDRLSTHISQTMKALVADGTD